MNPTVFCPTKGQKVALSSDLFFLHWTGSPHVLRVSWRKLSTVYKKCQPPTPVFPLSQVCILNSVFYLYILKSKKDNLLYVGSTNNLRRRLAEHNGGKVKSTKSRTPFELRYYEAYYTESNARAREQSLKKNGNALAQLKIRIKDSLQ